jgi:hypothetical protein
MRQKFVLVSWERILNDLLTVANEIEDLSEYSYFINMELEGFLHKRIQSVISRLKRKKSKKLYEKDLENWK